MPANDIQEQLDKYLADAHSIEEQALIQMRLAPGLAGSEPLERAFREHLTETERHEQLVRERMEARSASPSRFKDLVMKAGGAGFALFAKSQPDTPGKLVAHAYSYEHLELASYELLLRVAERAGDRQTAETARTIRDEERAMAQRLAGSFDVAVTASLDAVKRDDLEALLGSYLADAHAIENQAIGLLERAADIGGDERMTRLYAEHLDETMRQQELVEERLRAHGRGPSRFKDTAMKAGAINWATFFSGQPDTPGKLAAFAYAFEHLEIGGYEQLKRVAERAGDPQTVAAAEQILGQERAAAEKLAASFDHATELALEAQRVSR
jgi:ferritin-like metal-binding protein YciE